MEEPEILYELRAELAPGESLRWSGRPRQGIWVRASDAALIPFSILWCGFAIFWCVGATRAAGAFGLFGVPIVAVGLYMVAGRFVTDARTRANTVYGITDRRLISMKVGRRQSVMSTALNGLGQLELKEQANGRGTILYGGPASFGVAVPPNWPGAGSAARPRLDGIEDARAVYRLLQFGPADTTPAAVTPT